MNCRKLKIQSNLGVILETNMKIIERMTFGTSLLSMLDKIIQTKTVSTFAHKMCRNIGGQ